LFSFCSFAVKFFEGNFHTLNSGRPKELTYQTGMTITFKNRRNFGIGRIISILWPFLIALPVLLGVILAVRKPEMIEQLYSTGIYPIIAKSFSFFSRMIPFSLWDLFWIVLLVILLGGLILVVLKTIKLSLFILRFMQLLALLYSLFYISWGFNYFRPDIQTRLGWKIKMADEQFFRAIMDTLTCRSNRSYMQISPSEYQIIDKLVEESYQKNSRNLGIDYPGGTRIPKKMIFSSYFAKSGISGYFGPFFNEINLNNYLFPADYPFLLAHEKAHQFGIASEAEANLAAYIICTTSADSRLQYSGNMYLLLYFLKDAEQMNEYHELIKRIDKRVIDNIRYRERYYKGLQNKTLEKVQTAMNDVYLKSNHIKKGVKNYNHVVSLVMSWYYNSDLISEKQ
jgi:hypothetical protein